MVSERFRAVVFALLAAAILPACNPPAPVPIPPPAPVPAPPIYPPGLTYSVTPNPIGTVRGAGTAVTIKVLAAGGSTTLPGVPVEVEIKAGPDNTLTSVMSVPTGTGTKLTGTTDAAGLLVVTLKATAQGDRDDLIVTFRPGANSTVQTLSYATNP